MDFTFSGSTVISVGVEQERVTLILNDSEQNRKLTIGFKPDDAAKIGSILYEAAGIVQMRMNARKTTTSPVSQVTEQQKPGSIIVPTDYRPS